MPSGYCARRRGSPSSPSSRWPSGSAPNTAIFSLLNTVLLKSLPVSRPEQLVKLGMGEAENDVFTNPLWEAIRDQGSAFDGVFAIAPDQVDLALSGQARVVEASTVSGQFFSTLGVRPALGRLLQRDDDRRGCPSVAVVSHGFWQREYGGQTDVIGRVLSLNRHPVTIIGVTEPGFTGVEVGRHPQMFVPLCTAPVLRNMPNMLDERSMWWLQVIGRLPEGATADQMSGRFKVSAPEIYRSTLPSNWGADDQKDYLQRSITVHPAATGLSDLRLRYRSVLAILMGVVGIVLLIACANVANLLLARAAARQREIAMRLAIGASRGRIIRQALTESLLLSVLGAGLGLLFARWSSGLLVGMIGQRGSPVFLDLSLDGRVLAFTVLVAVATGLLFGVAPAWRSVTLQPQSVLKSGSPQVSATKASVAAGKLLVVSQVALSLVLVAGAGLLLGTFRALATINPGFKPEGVVLAGVDLTILPPAERGGRAEDLLRRLRSNPGVVSAGAAVLTPIGGMGWNSLVFAEGYQPAGERENLVWFNGVTDGYFTTLGIDRLAGRDFDSRDRADGHQVAIVSQATARKLFGSTNPIGRQIWVKNSDTPEPPMEIVGVVGDAKYRSLRDTLAPTVYRPWVQADEFGALTLIVRTREETARAIPGILEAAKQVLPNTPLGIRTLSGELSRSLTQERLMATLSGFFGGLALLLALVGLYGTMAYNVTRKRKEIGIRVALGATRARLIRLIAGEAGQMIVAGVVLGGLATIATTRLVRSLLYGRSPLDPLTLFLAAALVAGVALLAGALPAIRAVRQDPQAVLREE